MADPGGDVPLKRGGELGSGRERAAAGEGRLRIEQGEAVCVDDDDAAARGALVALRDTGEAGGGFVRPRSSVSSAKVAIVSASCLIRPSRLLRSLRPYWIPSGISSDASTTAARAM